MMPLEDSVKKHKTYVKVNQKWYKKLWYFISFRKKKIAKWQELGNIKEIYIGDGNFEIMEIEEE